MKLSSRPNAIQNKGMWLPMSKTGAWVFSKTMHGLDMLVFKLSGGKNTATSIVVGFPMIVLTSKGAKSGEKRSVPLIGIPNGKDKIIVVASNWGQKHHAGWYFNLMKHPQCEVTVNDKTEKYTAHETKGAEREKLWKKAVEVYKGYDLYKVRAGREIPVFLLEKSVGG
jgi:deazaflavin-dependent oxidoreductase (nitroreductase family)